MRTLTAAIEARVDSDLMDAVWVLEVKSAAGQVLARATNWNTIADWDGVGSEGYGVDPYGTTPYGIASDAGYALDTLVEVPEIRQTLDWRGGLAHFSEQQFVVADVSGLMRRALRSSMNLDVEVWFLLRDGAIDKATQSVQIYAGYVSGYQVEGRQITIFSGDRRRKRYPENLLSKVELGNDVNFCGAGRLLEESGGLFVWNVGQWEYRDIWIPDLTRDRLIPITFNRPQRCKLIQVSGWSGGETLVTGQHLRGPIFVLSDMRIDYGTDLVLPVGAIFRLDQQTGEIWNATSYNNIKANQVPGVTGYRPIVCIGASESLNNAWRAAKAINTFARIWPQNRDTIHSGVVGDWGPFYDRLEDEFQALRLVSVPGNVTILDISFVDSPLPSGAGKVRHAYVECNIKNYGDPLPVGSRIRIRLSRNPDWSGHSDEFLDEIVLLTNSVHEFNNWDWGSGAQSWADGNVSFGGDAPFSATGALGPQRLDTFRSERLALGIRGMTDPLSDMDVRIFGFGLIVAVDFPLDDVADLLGAHCKYSFDNYAMSRLGGSDYCRAYETIYATLRKVMDVAESDILAASGWATRAGTGWHDKNRLDFQLQEDLSGADLLDRMALQGSLWLAVGDDGKEEPIFLNRLRGRGVDEAALAPDFDSDTIRGESLTIGQGEEDDLYTRFRVRFDQDNFGGGFREEFYVDENSGNCPTAAINDRVAAWCTAAQAKHGITRELVFEADMIQDEGTAERLLLSLASRLVDRPWRVRFGAPLAGIRWQLGDFPVIEHDDWLEVAAKLRRDGLTFTAESSLSSVLIPAITDGERADLQPGDWCLLTGASLAADGMDGWYRLTYSQPDGGGDGQILVFVADGPMSAEYYNDVSLLVLPAMMVTAAQISGAGIELELTEIPRDPEVSE